MTAKTVRAAIQAYLSAANVPGLTSLYRTLVPETPASAFVPAGGTAGASAFVWLIRDVETPRSVGGAPSVQPNGWREVHYNAAVIFDYRVLKPATTDDAWADGLDDMCEGIKVALRADPNLGTAPGPGAIFTAANTFPDGGPAITVILEEPLRVTGTGSLTIHGAIDFPVVEMVPPG